MWKGHRHRSLAEALACPRLIPHHLVVGEHLFDGRAGGQRLEFAGSARQELPGVVDHRRTGRAIRTFRRFSRKKAHRRRSMLTWCRSAVNRPSPSRLAARRMRSSACDTLSQLCVWHVLCRLAFPLAPPLPSTVSAAGAPALFDSFFGTMSRSDFPCPCIIGLACCFPMRSVASDNGRTRDLPVPAQVVSTRARGLRPRGAGGPLAITRLPCCLPLFSTASALQMGNFRGSIPCPRVPLSTLRRHPHGWQRTTPGSS